MKQKIEYLEGRSRKQQIAHWLEKEKENSAELEHIKSLLNGLQVFKWKPGDA